MNNKYIPCICNDSNCDIYNKTINYIAYYVDSKGHFTLIDNNSDNWVKVKVSNDDIMKVLRLLVDTGGPLKVRFNDRGFGEILNSI